MDIKDFASAVAQIAEEKGISAEKVFETIEQAIAAAYKKDYGKKGQIIKAKLDQKSGDVKFWQVKIVVDEESIYSEEELEKMKDKQEDEETEGKRVRFNPEKHIMIEEAKLANKKIKVGDELETPLETQKDYGRIAAQTAKQVIMQKLREAERESIFGEYKDKEGEIISGIVQRIEGQNVFLDIGKTLGILIKEEQVPGEFYRPGQRLKVFVFKVEDTSRGPRVFLSRAYPKLISKLFELEVPEIASDQVQIKSIAREAGSRTKIAVASDAEGIDPIGACFPGRTLVLMEDFTFKPIVQLSEGEAVLTHLGNRRIITKKYKRIWSGTLAKFKIFGLHKPIEVTKEHPLLWTSNYGGKTIFKEASKIKTGFLAIPTLKKIVFDKTIYHFEKDKNFLWVLGMYLAEGSLDKAEVNFTLSQEEKDKALKIQEIMKKYGGKVYIKARKPNRGKGLDATLFGYDWVEIFEELGNRYCDRKRINSRLMFLEPKLQLEIFKGWIDGDSYFHKKRNRTIGVTTSEELLWQMYYILLRNRIRGNMQKRKMGKKMKKQAYQLEISNNKMKDYRGFFRGNYYFSRIRSTGKVPFSAGRRVYNLEIEKDNSYIVYSVGVHNCVGQRGTRVQAIINELGGEKIDIIEWSDDPEKFIANALSPAKVLEVKLLPKNKVLCIVPEDQLSLAIGKEGQNVRLAAKLTGWKIDVRSSEQTDQSLPEEKEPVLTEAATGKEGKEEKTEKKKEKAKKKTKTKTVPTGRQEKAEE